MGGGGGEYAAAWTRELRASGNLFTPRTAEYRVWDGAVAAAGDAAGTAGGGTGRGYAAGLDPVLHHAGGYHTTAKKVPGAASISFDRRHVANRPGTARVESRAAYTPGTGQTAGSPSRAASKTPSPIHSHTPSSRH